MYSCTLYNLPLFMERVHLARLFNKNMKTNLFKLTVLYFKLKAQNHPLQHKYSILCKKTKKKQNIPRPLLYLLCSRYCLCCVTVIIIYEQFYDLSNYQSIRFSVEIFVTIIY